MKKPLVTLAVSLTVGIGSLFGGYTVKTEASSIQSLKQKKNEIGAQRSNMATHINQADQKIANLQNQQANVEKDIERIGLAIEDTNQKISTKTNQISDTKTEIEKLQAEIAVLKERIKKRNEMLKDRARNYQENGGMINYLDVLMGSQSFNDFVDRANAVATIMEADQEILKQHEADKEAVEKNQTKVETDLTNLEGMLSDLNSMKEKMNGQVAEQKKLMVSLQKQEKETQDDKLSMEEQNSILAAQDVAIQKAIKMEQNRQAEAARRAAEDARRAAEEAARRAAAAAAGNSSSSNSSSGNSSSGGSDQSGNTPAVSSGNFTRPAEGVISSGYGPRVLSSVPGDFHYGVDIANHGDNVPIVAAADGIVAVSHYSQSYGNVVYITHSINGEIFTTVYAHMRMSLVSAGAMVSKGQQIGIMGSTGEAVGQHLHFELYRGPWRYHSAINPVGIVPL